MGWVAPVQLRIQLAGGHIIWRLFMSALTFSWAKLLLVLSAFASLSVPFSARADRVIYSNEQVLEGSLTSPLAVSDLRMRKQDQLLFVQARISNGGEQTQQLFYRFKWLDRDGFSVWDDEPWKPMLVYGNQTQTIQAVSPTFQARTFRLVLQGGQNYAHYGEEITNRRF